MITHFISKAINQLLQNDPHTKEKLKKINNKVMTLICNSPLPIILQCSVQHDNVCITFGEKLISDTKISGTPLSLFRASILQFNSDAHQLDDVSIEGDMELAESWLRLLREADIDFEEMLAKYMGDIGAHTCGNVFRHLKKTVSQQLNALEISTYEYLHEESDWFPTKESLNEFFEEVDKIRVDTDRLEAKLTLLSNEMKDDL